MKTKEKFTNWWKEFRVAALITAIVISVLLLAIFPQTAGIISFIIVDCVVGYMYRNKIISNRVILQTEQNQSISKHNENSVYYNLDYYDLYQEVNYNRLMVMLKSICLALTICPTIFSSLKENIISYIGISVIMMLIFFLIACIFLFEGSKNKNLIKLCNKRKENWIGEYTQEELEILGMIKSNSGK